MRHIKKTPGERWNSTRISEIMTPAGKFRTAYPQQSAASLLEQMNELEISHMPVSEDDKAIGVVSRDSLIRLVKTRTELRM